MKLKIALTVDPELPVPPTHYGGIERVVDMLARDLERRGHHVTLFAAKDSTCPVDRSGWPGSSSTSPADTLRNAALLARRVLIGGFDIVHSFSRLAYLAPLLPLTVPKLMSYQRQISNSTTSRALALSRGTLEFSAISRQMIAADKLAGRWHLVPNGVPLDTFTFVPDVPPVAPLVFLGRVEEIKGPHLAIEIARRTGRALVIAGNIPPDHRAWFDAHVAPHIDGTRVRYIGAVDDRQKNHLLGAAAAFLMPILWEEPFGIVMAEAMACGTPVLGLARGAVPEVVEDGVTGFVRETLDELTDCVARVPALRRRESRLRVEQHYSAEAVGDGYLRIYTDMIERIGRKRRGAHLAAKAAA